MRLFLTEIAKNIVDFPENVIVNEIGSGKISVFELSVEKQDVGKIIGIKGRTIEAIRTLMTAASGKLNKRVIVEVLES